MMANTTQSINSESPETLKREVYRRRGRRREQQRQRQQQQQKQKLSNKRVRSREVANGKLQELSTKEIAACVPVQPVKKVVKNEQNSVTLPSTLQCRSEPDYQKTDEQLSKESNTNSQCNMPASFVAPQELIATTSTEAKEEQLKSNIENNSNLKGEVSECNENEDDKQDDDDDAEEEDEEDVLILRCIAPLPNASCNVSCIRVGPTNVRVGRSKALCDVVLPPFPGLSRLHCVLSSVGDEISVHDRSSNGTFINGRCIGRNRCAMLHVRDFLTFIPSGAAHAEECTFTIDATSLTHHSNWKQERICKAADGNSDVNTALLPSKQTVPIVPPSLPFQSLSSSTEKRSNATNENTNTAEETSFIVQVSKTNNNTECTDDTNYKVKKKKRSALCPERFAKLVSLSEPPMRSLSDLLSVPSDPTLHEEVTIRYALGPVLGQGSFAVVRLGVHHLTKAQVAIKLIDKRHFAQENASHAELLMEAQIMMQIHHRHIVKVLDVYDGVDHIALVMELAREGDLFDYIVGRGKPPFTEREARLLFVQLLEALIYLHSQHVMHNDIKPENVLVMSTRDTNEETVTIAAVEQPSFSSSPLMVATDKNSTTEFDVETNDSEVHSESSSVCVMKPSDDNSHKNNKSNSYENRKGKTNGKTGNRTVSSELENTIDAFSVVDDHQFEAPCLSPLEVCLKLTDFGAAEFYGKNGENSDDRDEENETEVKVQEEIHQRRLWKAYTPMYTAPENEDNADNDEAEELECKNANQHDQHMHQESQEEFEEMEDEKHENSAQDSIKRNNSNAKRTKMQNTNAADIWSAGILLYVMCTGVLPKKIYKCDNKFSPSTKKPTTVTTTTSIASSATFTGVEFTKHANHLSDLCKELIHGMLAIDPAHRMTLHDICHHAWLHGMRIDGMYNV